MASVVLAAVPVLLPTLAVAAGTAAMAATATPASANDGAIGSRIAAIKVIGNHRITAATILSYILLRPGDPFSSRKINLSLKTLYATGLFSNVSINRQGNDLMIRVVENPVVNEVFFRGNKVLKDKDLSKSVSLKPGAVFTRTTAVADTKTILGKYAKKGHYDAKVNVSIVKLPENRVNVVFNCTDGPQTPISRINFIGNAHYSQARLRGAISSGQSTWYSFLSSSDQYSPERVRYDEELLRRFYFHHGYADFRIKSTTAQLAPNRKSFYLTFVIDEGPRYRISSVRVVSSIKHLSASSLRGLVHIYKGDWFDGDALRSAVKAISDAVQNRGFAFAQVEPDIAEDHKNDTIALTFRVIEGPRVYINSVNIFGNTRTDDAVIRRQITLAPGDPFNQNAVDQSKQNLENLGFFKPQSVSIKPTPASQPDEVNLGVRVAEQSTGQFSLGGGYSTGLGALANAGLSQNNFLGTGINASISALVAQRGTQYNLGVTNPYFYGRNLLAGVDLFRTDTYNYSSYVFSESAVGADIRLGWRYNRHISQTFTYTISSRTIYNVASGVSFYILNEEGKTSLSQVGQSLTFDYLNNIINPSKGSAFTFNTDFAGLGGTAKFVRVGIHASHYIPLKHYLGNKDWVLEFRGHVGYLFDLFGYKTTLADRYFLGGDSLLGFQDGGVGPHDTTFGDSLGGRFIWTGDTLLHFPLPAGRGTGLSGFAFIDVGSLSLISNQTLNGKPLPIYDNAAPRVSAGVGISWDTPFGMIDVSFAEPIKKYKYDQVEQFRVSFGKRF